MSALRLPLFLVALFATALAADAFPPMKNSLAVLALALVALFLSGCTTGVAAKLNKMPDGRFSSALLEETDKFTSTTIKLSGVTKDNGELTAAKITVDHTNPWLTKLHFEAEDYAVQLSRAAQKKPLSPVVATGVAGGTVAAPATATETR